MDSDISNNRQKYLAALRSGKYDRGSSGFIHELTSTGFHRYNNIGVGCVVLGIPSTTSSTYSNYTRSTYFAYEGHYCLPPNALLEALGISTKAVLKIIYPASSRRYGFERTADLLEEQWKQEI